MNRSAAKTKKLLTKPGLFFRDLFLNQYPLEVTADINRPRKHDVPLVKDKKKAKPVAAKVVAVKTERLLVLC